MAKDDILAFILCLVEIPERLRQAVASYVMMLMMETPRHSMSLAAEISGLDPAQFSRLLASHGDFAQTALTGVAAHVGRRSSPGRKPLVKGSPWKVAIIVDAMIVTARTTRADFAARPA